MEICILDTETTGLDVEKEHIIEFAAARVETDTWEIIETCSGLIRHAGVVLTPEITLITGITQDQIHRQGVDISVIVNDFYMSMSGVKAFVAHNTGFDKPIIINNFKRHKKDVHALETTPWICTLQDIKHSDRFKCRKLSHLALDYGVAVNPKDLHRALDDVKLVVAMLKARGEKFENDMHYALSPKKTYVAQPKPPWEDNGKQKNMADGLGFKWDGSKKRWVAKFPEGHVFPNVPFKIVEVEG